MSTFSSYCSFKFLLIVLFIAFLSILLCNCSVHRPNCPLHFALQLSRKSKFRGPRVNRNTCSFVLVPTPVLKVRLDPRAASFGSFLEIQPLSTDSPSVCICRHVRVCLPLNRTGIERHFRLVDFRGSPDVCRVIKPSDFFHPFCGRSVSTWAGTLS